MQGKDRFKQRIGIYLGTILVLLVWFFIMRDSTWVGNKQLHTLMELLATVLAAFVGTLALIRYYTKKNNTFLFIGTGFIGTAFLDGYHTIVTSTFFDALFPSVPSALIPWSWNASRYFLAILMFISWWAWRREDRLGENGRISERTVYIGVALFTLASFFFFALYPLPRAYYPELFFGRPEEFGAALIFLLALIGYLKKGWWKHDSFEHWVILSLIVGFLGQAIFMPFSFQLFDFSFDAAHGLKKLSYLFMLTGLLISVLYLFRQEEEGKEKLEHTRADLEERNKLLQLICGSIPVMIALYSRNNEILFVNKAFEETLGWSFDEIKKINILEKNYPDPKKRKKVIEFMSSASDEWRDFKTTTKAGKVVDTSWYSVRLSDSINIGIGQDITARKKAEEEINNLAKFPSENPNPVLRVSAKDGIILYANAASRSVLGKMGCEVGKKAPAPCLEKIKESAQANQSKMFDIVCGSKIFSFVVARAAHAGYANLYGRDVTKERKIEQMKNEFISLVSHQLKTPVAQMRGYVDNMLSGLAGGLTDKQKQYLLDMEKISSRNYRLISNLLNLSQIERGIISMYIQRIEVSEIVDAVIQEYRKSAESKGLTIKFDKAESDIIVNADKDKTIEVLSNIVNNAIKFTDKGSITITIRSDHGYGVIEVSDTGVGMSKDIQSQLFKKREAFSGPPVAGGGAGLGLYIAKSFMEQQHGDIAVTSIAGQGSIFVIKIPLANDMEV